jgi:hypothetical protein
MANVAVRRCTTFPSPFELTEAVVSWSLIRLYSKPLVRVHGLARKAFGIFDLDQTAHPVSCKRDRPNLGWKVASPQAFFNQKTMRVKVAWFVNDGGTRRIVVQFRCRPSGSSSQFATTVRANSEKIPGCTFGAEGTFVCTDTSITQWIEGDVALFTVGRSSSIASPDRRRARSEAQ